MDTVRKRKGDSKKATTSHWRPAALVEIVGQKRIVVENHCGVCYYGDDRVLIKTHNGYIEIIGGELHLRCISREHLCITGALDAVKLIGGDGDSVAE